MGTTDSRSNAVKFCFSYLASAFGYEFIFFVMTVHIYNLTGSAVDVGIFTAITFLPKLLSPYYGSMADKYNRKHIFIGASTAVCLFVLLMASTSEISLIYCIWFVISIFAMVIMNVRTAIMTEIMPKDNYVHGNSIVLIALNLARLLAPLLAGFITVFWPPASVLYITALIYLTSALLALFIHLPKSERPVSANAASSIVEGIRFVLASRDLSYLAMVGIGWRFFLGMQASLFVVYVKSHLGLDDSSYGIFMTVIGVGSLVGSYLGPRLASRFEIHRIIVWGLTCHYLTFSALGIINNFYLSLAVIFLSFLVFYVTIVGVHSKRDKATEVRLRGRVYGCITAIITPPALISMLSGGFLANTFGVDQVFLYSGLLAVSSLLLIELFYLRNRNEVAVVAGS